MTNITRNIVKPGESSLVPHRLHGLGDAPKPETGHSKGIFGQTTVFPHVFASQLQMRLEFFFHLAITRVSSERSP
jgi:hypothetical protein